MTFPPAKNDWISLDLRRFTLALGILWAVAEGGFLRAAQPAGAAAEIPAELTAAARDYRIEIYGAFRQNRAEYDQRRKQAEALLAEWQARGSLADEAALLSRWFDDARRAATRQQPPPAIPDWNGAAEVVPLPPRSRLPSSIGQVQPLRTQPPPRARSAEQVQMTGASFELLRPQESSSHFDAVAALPATSCLSMVLALQDAQVTGQGGALLLAKSNTPATVQISHSTLALPAAKLNLTTLASPATTSSNEETAELNTAELRARLRGYDKAWRAVQADLYSAEELTLERAGSLLAILGDLQQARRDLQLYQAIAPGALQQEIRELPALDELQKRLRQLIETARADTINAHTLAPEERAKLKRAWQILAERGR